MENPPEICFICADETSSDYRNLLQLVTKYSGTLVYKVIERFLGGDLSESVAGLIASVICQECVVKLNDYDAAYTKAIIIQKEFTDLLKKSLTLVGSKICVNEVYLKKEPEGSYIDDIVECDQTLVDDSVAGDVQSVARSEETVSMKCNTCGESFRSMNDMRNHSHKPKADEEPKEEPDEEIEFRLEFLDESDNFSLGDIEYIDEERLYEDDNDSMVEDSTGADKDTDFEGRQHEAKTIITKQKLDPARNRCAECDIDLGSKIKLKRHIRDKHSANRDASGDHVCHICGVTVKTKSHLTAHVSRHGRIFDFTCAFCGKKFQSNGALLRHLPMHTGEKPYQCEQCGKQFCHQSSFNMHRLMHDDIREKKCEICGFRLRNGSHLKRHMRIHSGERPFECPTCGQKFAQRYNMTAHLKAHQGIYREQSRVYKCPLCDHTFQRKLKLQEHLTREHNTTVDSVLLKPLERTKINKKDANVIKFVTDDSAKLIGT
ncbi:zinc finger protein interacting with ribonucleoprotein K-like [Topomyia yanbarensis]|uniref:zinc finger protein interacting with ribonucleoprotein K-like n=1 Tax=Topomyia yanbarensis TaxID=2498891 RepID=UPI00273AE37F|nr:zinc finger protein interacting with ribonucleoprotein K-like [Topomyia yanbarensis]